MARRLVIEPHDPPARRPVAQALERLAAGDVVAYATDTLYALGCAIDATKSAERIYRIKGMEKSHRLALLCPDVSAVAIYGHLSQPAFRLAQRVFPGPYTLIVPATSEVPKLLLDKRRRTVGVRVPDHPVLQALLAGLGRPLLTTSAISREGQACADADEVAEAFGDEIDLIIDSGSTPGEPSTVIEVLDEIVVTREGLGPIDVL